jgi:hypothetical protein
MRGLGSSIHRRSGVLVLNDPPARAGAVVAPEPDLACKRNTSCNVTFSVKFVAHHRLSTNQNVLTQTNESGEAGTP